MKKATTPRRAPKAKRPKVEPLPLNFKLDADGYDEAAVLLLGLRIAAQFASTDDARPFLTGVHVTSTGSEVVIESTDSYTLARIVWPHKADRFNVNIPARWIKRVVPKPNTRRALQSYTLSGEVTFPQAVGDSEGGYTSPGDVTFQAHGDGESFTTRLINGPYPNLAKVMPAADAPEIGDDGRVTGFNPQLLRRCFDAAWLWGEKSKPIVVRSLDQMKPALFNVETSLPAELSIVLMPVRLIDADRFAPRSAA